MNKMRSLPLRADLIFPNNQFTFKYLKISHKNSNFQHHMKIMLPSRAMVTYPPCLDLWACGCVALDVQLEGKLVGNCVKLELLQVLREHESGKK